MGPSVMVKEKYGLNVSLNLVYSKAYIEAKRCRLLEAPDTMKNRAHFYVFIDH